MKIRKVNRAKKGNRFCGPAVISAVTGMTTDEASRLIRHIAPHRTNVMGTYTWEIRDALAKCSIVMVAQSVPGNPTLAQWFKDSVKERSAGRVFLISAGSHWQLVSGRRFVCGKTTDIVPLDHEKVKRRARVRGVWELVARPEVKIPKEIVTPPPKRKEAAETQARRLAKEYEVDLEKERDSDIIAVYPPVDLYPEIEDEGEDPYDGNHIHYDWHEALRAVKTYVEICRKRGVLPRKKAA